jgi:pimeloyl-ACP methyl ester carboxylesterase
MKLIQIPALGCDDELYGSFDAHLPATLEPQTIVTVADRMSACVEQVVAQAPEQFILMGTSFGARVAMETAVTAPERVKALIIIGSGPGPVVDQAGGLKRSARVRGGEFDAVLKEMGDIISHLPGPRGPATMEAFRTMGRRLGSEKFALQSDALAHRGDLWPQMAHISCPVLCLWGAHDQFSAPDVGEKIAATVRNGKCIVLENCGHFPTLEYPEDSARIVAEFLGNQLQ